MGYTDNTDKEDGTIIVKLEQMMKGVNIRTDRVEAAVEAMKVLGLKVDSKLTDAIVRVLSPTGDVETVKYSGFNVEVISVKYGTIVMYID